MELPIYAAIFWPIASLCMTAAGICFAASGGSLAVIILAAVVLLSMAVLAVGYWDEYEGERSTIKMLFGMMICPAVVTAVIMTGAIAS